MKYRIDTAYVWYNQGTMIVLMYFINHVPFTFDELPDCAMQDLEIIHLADNERRFEPATNGLQNRCSTTELQGH